MKSDLESSINDTMIELKGFLRAEDVPVPYILSVGCACHLSFKAIFMHKQYVRSIQTRQLSTAGYNAPMIQSSVAFSRKELALLQVPIQVRSLASRVLRSSSRPCAMLVRESRLPSSFCVREVISEQVTWQAFRCSWLLHLLSHWPYL